MVIATLQVAQVIILESFLSFLGLGVQPPTPAWGNMLGEGRVYMLNSWWIAAFPGAAIFVTTLAINLMGNALRDWLDPHMKLMTGGDRVRLFLAMLSHETNTFSNVPTDRRQFEARDLRYGGEIVETFRGTGTCLGGMIEAAERLGRAPGALGGGLRLAGRASSRATSTST